MRLFLSGGGDAPDSIAIDRAFVAALGDGPLLYWPFARPPASFSSCRAWFEQHMSTLGVSRLETWTALDPRQSLARYAGLYIGGGDTFLLRATIGAAAFDETLVDAARAGLPIFGGSAGAILLGADVATWLPEGMAEPPVPAARGLDLLAGLSVWVEYQPAQRAMVQAWSARRGSPVLALADAAGVVVDDRGIRSSGRDPALRITPTTAEVVS